MSCQHQPPCPIADCVLHFEDTGELLPDGQIIAPHRPLASIGVIAA